MSTISSQDLRNTYEKFYSAIRRYLWPYDVLKDLAEVEVNIYSAFPNLTKLCSDLDKLAKSMKDTLKDDPVLSKYFTKLCDQANDSDGCSYHRLFRVNEINPDKMKQLKVVPEDKEDEL